MRFSCRLSFNHVLDLEPHPLHPLCLFMLGSFPCDLFGLVQLEHVLGRGL